MRSGKTLILATKEFAKENKLQSWWYLLSTAFLLIVAQIGTYWNINLVAKIICSILTSLMIVRMFMIYHDHQHKAILAKSKAANVIMYIFGLYVLAPPSIWKRSHDHHHKHNSKLFSASIGSYPIMTKQKFISSSRAERFGYLAVRHPLNILFGYFSVFMYGMCISSFLSSPEKHYDSLIALILHVAVSSLLFWFGGWTALLLTWVFPFFITCAMGAYLFYAQHNFPGVTFKNNIEWSYDHAALESSSYMKMSPVMSWFTGNIGYHHIHHINAHIPFYRLPEAMDKIPELQEVTTTSWHPKDVMNCLKLKVWDSENNQMLGLSELRKDHFYLNKPVH